MARRPGGVGLEVTRAVVSATRGLIRGGVVGDGDLHVERLEHADQHRPGVLLGLSNKLRLLRGGHHLLLGELVELLLLRRGERVRNPVDHTAFL